MNGETDLAMGFGSDFLAQRHAENTHPVRMCQSSVAGAAGTNIRLKPRDQNHARKPKPSKSATEGVRKRLRYQAGPQTNSSACYRESVFTRSRDSSQALAKTASSTSVGTVRNTKRLAGKR